MSTRSLVYAFLFLLMASAARGQWVQQESGTTENLQGISAPSVAIATAVGENATILRTVNSGMNWTPQAGEPNVDYRAVSCVGTVGLAAGTGGTISFTTNGGSVWQTIDTGWMHPHHVAHQISASVGAVAGVNSIFQPIVGITSNGWQTHPYHIFYPEHNGSEQEGAVTDIYLFDENTAFASIAVWDGQGAICKTVDGGTNWETIYWLTSALYGLEFFANDTGCAVGLNGTVVTTCDFGVTWEPRTSGTNQTLTDVDFADQGRLWAVGLGGTIIHSDDGGETWHSQFSPVAGNLNAVSFANWDTGYVAGDDGTILFTGNGGEGGNLPPGEFWRLQPADGSTISTPLIHFIWSLSEDPEGDPVTYHVRLWSTYLTQHGEDTLHAITNDTTATIQIPWPLNPLDELYAFYWTLHATDGFTTLEAANGQGEFVNDIVESADDPPGAPHEFSLSAYPNPFNPTTTLNLSLPVSSEATLRVFDVAGRLVLETRLGRLEGGSHEVAFEGSALPSGLYFAIIETPAARLTRKLVLLK